MNPSSKSKTAPLTASKTRKSALKSLARKTPAQTSTSLAETHPKPSQRGLKSSKKVHPKSGMIYKNACSQEFADPFKILSANFIYTDLGGDADVYENSDGERSEKSSDEDRDPVKIVKPSVKKNKRIKTRTKKRFELDPSNDFLYVAGDFEDTPIVSIKEPCELYESDEDENIKKKIQDGVIKSSFTLMPGLTRPIARKEGCLDISKLKIIHPISSIWKGRAEVRIEKKKPPKKKKTKRVVKKKKAGPGGDQKDGAPKRLKSPTKKLRDKKTRIV